MNRKQEVSFRISHHYLGRTSRPPVLKESWLYWILLTLILLVIALLRFRLLSFPLERDEGAFAYMGRLILDGIPPYTAAYDFKTPGLYVMYATFIWLFGETPDGVHTGLLFLNVLSTVLVFHLARNMFGAVAGLYSALAFGVLALSESVLGFAAHATHFVVPPALAGTALLLRAFDTKMTRDYVLSGSFMCLAFFMKQPAMFFVVFGFAAISVHHLLQKPVMVKDLIKDFALFGTGVVGVAIIVVGGLFLSGSFHEFWFWCFTYPSKYGTALPLEAAFKLLPSGLLHVAGGFPLLWIMAGVGLIVLPWYGNSTRRHVFLLVFVLFSFLAVTPGYYFRQHYFVVLLPGVAILAAVALQLLGDQIRRYSRRSWMQIIPAALLLLVVSTGILAQRDYYLDRDPEMLARAVYGGNPFQESLRIARVIEARTTKDEKIAILGSEPQIYFYSKRRSASSHIFTYPLVERHEFARPMQEEMIRDIEREQPRYMIFVSIPTSWSGTPESDTHILEWFSTYVQAHYLLEGLVEIISPERSEYYWDDRARGHTPNSSLYLTVYRRKES